MQADPFIIDRDTRLLRRRLFVSFLGLSIIYGVGTFGYYILGAGSWSLADCAYMTVISLTTVGYGEILHGIENVAYARLFTAVLLVSGAGIALYSLSILTTFLVEGEFLNLRRRRRMQRRIAKTSNHIIVCGAGRTGRHVANELASSHWNFVLIDINRDELEIAHSADQRDPDYLIGDATDDSVLIDAGIERAYGLISALAEDKDNLYVVVSARALNPKLRIIAKAVDPRSESKLRGAGANRVVSVKHIGAQRLASDMIRPNVVDFIEKMIRDNDPNMRFEQVTISPDSPLVGMELANSDIRRERKLLVVAAIDPKTGEYIYSPGPKFKLTANMKLIMLGETDCMLRLRESQMFSLTDRERYV